MKILNRNVSLGVAVLFYSNLLLIALLAYTLFEVIYG
ncbi:hypothetical protein FHU10_1224 [Serratia fonticola]|uniref:Uncharacterized protein n=1 Tax=Serratia fonticola TaxID=47917 RepID=A0A559T2E5_SERFO|nr:hypothetical protein FHU09_1227 [Serratia fonticola]TQI99243.1 hypothetical protein FHU11_4825 [Serratia fonticola]TVZ68768.1 hypothetical protein FHU10_1224 [Serratia fonticola]